MTTAATISLNNGKNVSLIFEVIIKLSESSSEWLRDVDVMQIYTANWYKGAFLLSQTELSPVRKI